ncbi:hypothetical protein HDU85_007557 [Gaertneriomyces sp. JEL0708]|nr:hypothetical protein HDU85_007557 [Gaertneriomyces sp. JEL0708]
MSVIKRTHHKKIALVTGCNSGLGYGILRRLLIQAREKDDPITIVMACRNKQRAEAARTKLIEEFFAGDRAQGEMALHILLVDLSRPASVLLACAEYRSRYSHLDYLLLNAGVLPCERMNIAEGCKNLVTRPSWVAKTGGDFFLQRVGEVTEDDLGLTFAANVFGHYIMVKELISSLRNAPSPRVLWFTSTTADPSFFDYDDYQCVNGKHPYESSKRLGELICLDMQDELRKQGIHSFIVSPGNCFTGLLDQGMFINFCWIAVLYIMRFLFVSGCNISAENGATSALHLTCEVENPDSLDNKKIFHSDITPLARQFVRLLDVDCGDPARIRGVRERMDVLYNKFSQR